MKVATLELIFRALNEARARYLVVGGVAVIAYGYRRTTEDVDLVLDLSSEALPQALNALSALGYRPMLPVSLMDFANPETRKDWIENRNMKVFNLISDQHPDATIDIFPKEPFVFEREYEAANWQSISEEVQVRIVSLPTLLRLKHEADRHRDRDDIENLRRLHPGQQD